MTGAHAAALALAALAVQAPSGARAEAPSDTAPLVLLIQGDAGDAQLHPDPALRLRRLRVGEDWRGASVRARVALEAQPSDRPWAPLEGGRLQGGPVRLTDAFLAWAPHRALTIDVGAQRVPFSLSRQVDEADLRLPERPLGLAAATPDFRPGVALRSDLGLLQFSGALMAAVPALDGDVVGAGGFGAFRLAAEPIGPVGVTPWRRSPDDPWYSWWRFSAAVSVLYGTLRAPRTLGVGGDGQLQWRRLTVTGEYLFLDADDRRQAAVLEPGLFLWRQRLELVLRGTWSRLGTADAIAEGAGLTYYSPRGRLRCQAGFERHHGAPDSGWAILRATLAL